MKTIEGFSAGAAPKKTPLPAKGLRSALRPRLSPLSFLSLSGLAACGSEESSSNPNATADRLPAGYQPPASTYLQPNSADPNLFALSLPFTEPYWVAALRSESHEASKAIFTEASNVINIAFPAVVPDYVSGGPDALGWSPASPSIQAAFTTIFADLERQIAVDFVPVASENSLNTISISQNTQTQTSGYAYFPSRLGFIGSDVFISNLYDDPQISGALTNYDYELLLHELGHALGFKHPFEADGGETTVLPAQEDNSRWTVLTYTVLPAAYDGAFRAFDLMALAEMFGVNPAYNSGDTTYNFNASAGTFILDGGGIDVVSAAGSQLDAYIDLRPGMHSHLSDKSPNITQANQLTISAGSAIERATGGDGDDHLLGNELNNLLFGGAGADRLFGDRGSDDFRGGQGNDLLDLSEGLAAKDRVIFESAASLNGQDRIFGFAQGSGGDLIDFAPMRGAALLEVVTSALVPVANISGSILRLVSNGLETSSALDAALQIGGAFSNLSFSANAEALVLTAKSQATGEDQTLYHLVNTGSDFVVNQLANFVGNYLDIDSWHAENFA